LPDGARKDSSVRTGSSGALWALGAVLVITGVGHRLLLAQIDSALDRVVKPAQPMSTLPLDLGPWQGRDEPVAPLVQKIAGDDDFVNRIYTHHETGRKVSLYIGYIGRPRSWLGHRPDVCYRAHGYEQIGQEAAMIRTEGGEDVPAILYEFSLAKAGGRQHLVLGNYLRNGSFLREGDDFREMTARRPNLFAPNVAYLARIQIGISASDDKAADQRVLEDFAGRIVGPVRVRMPEIAGSRH
jgi:hypothetical protein